MRDTQMKKKRVKMIEKKLRNQPKHTWWDQMEKKCKIGYYL